MKQTKLSPGLAAGILVACCFLLALAFRIIFPYDHVFTEQWIKFTGNDAWYHMRIIDNFVHNFPHFNTIDPYFVYNETWGLQRYMFFDHLSAGVIWILGAGSPSQHMVDVVGAFIPPVLGSLTVIPAYYIGKTICNRWAGVIAAAMIAILPGELLGRSVLGFTDHHAAEVLFTTSAMMFLVFSLVFAQRNNLSLDTIKSGKRAVLGKIALFSILAGLFLGIYMLTWRGAPIFIFIVFLFFVVQFVISHIKGRDTFYLFVTGMPVLITTCLISLGQPVDKRYFAALIIAICAIALMYCLSYLMKRKSLRAIYYPAVLLVIGFIGACIFYAASTDLFLSVLALFKRIVPQGARLATLEAQPILFPGDSFSLRVIWGNYTTGIILGLIGAGFLAYTAVKQSQSGKVLLLLWTIVMLIATLLMRRFAYYFAVNIALLTGYCGWLILRLFGCREQSDAIADEVIYGSVKKGKRSGKGRVDIKSNRAMMALGIVIVVLITIVPNIGPATRTAANPVFAPSDAWCESLNWLNENSPEPFGEDSYYYGQYSSPFKYPATAYSVAAWWDYGYWITRIGQRLPVCNPGGGDRNGLAKYLLTQNEKEASYFAAKLASKYVIIDYDTATIKFHAIPQYTGGNPATYFDVYYTRQDDTRLRGDYYFYPEYYRSLVVRLYNFDGGAVIPEETTVIGFKESVDIEGQIFKEIIDRQTFSTYNEALEYVDKQDSANFRIVGTDAFTSPVPLESLRKYTAAYASSEANMHPELGKIPEVKIFEYTGKLR